MQKHHKSITSDPYNGVLYSKSSEAKHTTNLCVRNGSKFVKKDLKLVNNSFWGELFCQFFCFTNLK